MTPRWLTNAEIDREKWDSCVASAQTGLVYAKAWYLDLVAPGWSALVSGDYTAVMPLPVKRMFGLFPVVYQPLLCQQLGVFYDVNVEQAGLLEKSFFENMPKRFWRVQLSVRNGAWKGERWERKPNFVLRLNQPHLDLALAYSSHHRRCVRKALNAGVVVMAAAPTPEEMVALVRQFQENKGNPVPNSLYPKALKIIQSALSQKEGLLYAARDAQGNLLAAIFYLHYQGRLINLLNVTLPAGRAVNAMHALTDGVIRRHALLDTVMDFEGSSIASLARFYAGFGARDEGYFIIA